MTTTLNRRITFTPTRPANTGVTFGRVLRSEWIKLTTVRSTIWSYVIVVLVSVGLAFLMSIGLNAEYAADMPAERQTSMIVQAATFGAFFGQLVIAVLGVLVISGEYTTGMIRSTLTAVPRRLPALLGKAVVLFVSSFVVGLVGALGAYAIAAPILAGKGIEASLTDPAVFMPILGSALYLAVVSVFALGIGAIVRSGAGGIATAVGLILLLPLTFAIARLDWMTDVAPYLLMNAGMSSFGLSAFAGESPLDTWQQVAVTLVWAAVALAVGAVLLKRRDA